MQFILKAYTVFEEIGLVYQDLKPDNILIKEIQKGNVRHYKLVFCDFGGAFLKDNDTMKYGDIYT